MQFLYIDLFVITSLGITCKFPLVCLSLQYIPSSMSLKSANSWAAKDLQNMCVYVHRAYVEITLKSLTVRRCVWR